MKKYIDADKLIAEIERWRDKAKEKYNKNPYCMGRCDALAEFRNHIVSLLEEQPNNMIQWTGNNLKEVIDFTGKSPRSGEWFKSWEEYENYVHTHNDILKLFCEDGSHYEVPVGAWIVKTPDGYNTPSRFRLIQKPAEWSEEDEKTRLNLLSELFNLYVGSLIKESTYFKYKEFLKNSIPKIKQLTIEQKSAISRAIFIAKSMGEESLARNLNTIYNETNVERG